MSEVELRAIAAWEANDGVYEIDRLMEQVRAEVQARHTTERAVVPPRLSTDEIFERVLAEVARMQSNGTTEGESRTRASPVAAVLPLGELLAQDDEAFVVAAYRGLLRREPDAEGLELRLTALRRARLTKIDVLGQLRYSPEGRRQGVHVPGLLWRYGLRRAFRVPMLGHLLANVYYLIRLPSLARGLEETKTLVYRDLGQLRHEMEGQLSSLARGQEENKTLVYRDLGQLRHEMEGQLSSLARGLQESKTLVLRDLGQLRREFGGQLAHERVVREQALQRLGDEVAAAYAATERDIEELHRADEETRSSLIEELHRANEKIRSAVEGVDLVLARHAEQLVEHRRELLDQARRLTRVLEELQERSSPTAGVSSVPASVSDELEHALDAFYVSFEDRFRGAREDIRQRVSVYLPDIRAAGAGSPERPIVDIGCGRGEWLELLRDEGLRACGVDLNRVMVQQCQERGLEVTEGDALAWMRSLAAGSLGAVTAFHVVEHLPFAQVVALFDEALRALAPGGVVIFETPNPENLIVGSCTFYSDPTHRNPIPPDVLLFVAQTRGFERAEIKRLHPPHWVQNTDEVDGMPPRLKAAMTAPQDYSVIAFRPYEQPR